MSRFGEVIQDLMDGGSKAVRRTEWEKTMFVRYSELWNIFELHAPMAGVTQLEELNLSPGDLFADDWDIVTLDPRTGKVTE